MLRRRIFYQKNKAREVIFQEWDTSINFLPFPKYDDRCKAHAMLVFHWEMEIEEAEKKLIEAERDLDWVAQ